MGLKKNFISLIIGICIAMLLMSFAGSVGAFFFKKELKIGFFDLETLQKDLPAFQQARERLKVKQSELELYRGTLYKKQQDEYKTQIKNLATEKDGKSPTEQAAAERRLQNLMQEKTAEVNSQITKKQLELDSYKKVELQSAMDNLKLLLEEVSAKRKMAAVVEKSVVLYGGTDVTQFVLEQAKQKKPAAAESTPETNALSSP